MIGYPAIMTAYLFHQRFIADVKGWPLELLASSITLFALVSVAVTMAPAASSTGSARFASAISILRA